MLRSLIVILLAIVCGVSAAIGVSRLAPDSPASSTTTQTVFVAAQSIRRGAVVTEELVKPVKWPVDLVPTGVATKRNEIVGRSALAGITANEPFFQAKLSTKEGNGFASNAIKKGMRACTIQTSGPSASVAGFVRPGDRVDVLLNLRGNSRDETGGGSSVTLLQAVEILAIDDILDVDGGATVKMWIKEGLTSVTLLVTPEQALLLSLGQTSGTLSLALRNGDDLVESNIPSATLQQIRDMQRALMPIDPAVELAADAAAGTGGNERVTANGAGQAVRPVRRFADEEPPPPPPTFIRTLRGGQAGQIRVVRVNEANR